MDRQIDAQSEQRWTNSSRKCDNNDSYSYSAESFPSQKATPTFSYRPFSLPLVLLLTQGKHYFFTSLFKWGYLQLREVPRLQVIKLRFEYGRVIENYAFGWCGGSVGVSGSFSHSGSIGALLCLEKGLPPPRGGAGNTGSQYAAHDWQPPCLSLQSSRIAGMDHHTGSLTFDILGLSPGRPYVRGLSWR